MGHAEFRFPTKKIFERKTSIRNWLRGSELHLRHGSTFGVYGEGGIWMPGSKGPPAGLESIEKSPSHNRALTRCPVNLCGRKVRR